MNDKEKMWVCKSIKYYRKHNLRSTGSSKWTQQQFLLNNEKESICSRTTFSAIEKGYISARSDVYEELLLKFNLRYNPSFSVENSYMENEFHILLKSVEIYDVANIEITVERIRTYLKKFEKYIIFHEYIKFIDLVSGYYTNWELPNENDLKFVDVFIDMVDPSLKEILIDLVFKAKTRMDDSDYDLLQLHKCKSVVNQINYLLELVYGNKLSLAHGQLYKIRNILEESQNIIRLLDLCNIHFPILTLDENDTFVAVSTELLNIIDSNKDIISSIKLAQSYKHLAIYAFLFDEFEISEKGIYNFLEIDTREVAPYTVILVAIFQKLYAEDKIIELLKDTKISHDNRADILLNFFIMKYIYKYSTIELSEYISLAVIPILEKYDKVYIKVFHKEISDIVDILHNYKLLTSFYNKTGSAK